MALPRVAVVQAPRAREMKLVWLALLAAVNFSRAAAPMHKTSDIMAWPAEPADAVVAYGPGPLQNAELRLPKTPGPHPVAVVLHGGCWQAAYDRTHTGRMSAALARAGFAVWTPEFRRLGDAGGGWPGTFSDIGDAVEKLRAVGEKYSLDLTRVVLVGHSAGGHLALWYAGAPRLPATSPLHRKNPLPIRGVVALAAVSDLRAPDTACEDAGVQLIGGGQFLAARLRDASPLAMLPLGAPSRLIHGALDKIVPPALSRDFAAAAQKSGDDAREVAVAGTGHFELIDPTSPAWPAVLAAVRELAAAKE